MQSLLLPLLLLQPHNPLTRRSVRPTSLVNNTQGVFPLFVNQPYSTHNHTHTHTDECIAPLDLRILPQAHHKCPFPHIHTHSLAQIHTHSHPITNTLAQPLTLTYTHIHTHITSHTSTHTLTLAYNHTLSHMHTHTPSHTHRHIH